MQRILLSHLEKVRNLSDAFNTKEAVAYSCAASQRQLEIYKKSTFLTNWGNYKLLSQCLNDCWEWLDNNSVITFDYIFPEEKLFNADTATGSSVFAQEPVFSVAYTIDQIKGIEPSSVSVVSENGLNILDALSYALLELDVNPNNDNIVDDHPLIKQEIQRQLRDLKVINEKGISHDVIKNLRCSKETLTEGEWFPENY